ncbi:hypothetical protein [Plantactinospora veratri]
MSAPAAAVGRAHPRLEGREKVTGTARYAVEHPAEDLTYGWAVQATVAKGRIIRIDTTAAMREQGYLRC